MCRKGSVSSLLRKSRGGGGFDDVIVGSFENKYKVDIKYEKNCDSLL